MITEVRTAIYTQVLTASSLTDLNTFWAEAPQAIAEDPYCVLSLISNPITRDSEQEFEEVYFQVSLYGTTLLTLEEIENEVYIVLQNSEAALNALLSTKIATQIISQFRTSLKVDEKYWHVVIRYRLSIK